MKALLLLELFIGLGACHRSQAQTAPAQLPASPCYGQNLREQAQRREMMQQMRSLRPGANAQMQRHSQTQANQQISDWQSRASAMAAPYVARANQLAGAARGCADEGCAAAIANQTIALTNDVINTLVPQIQAMARAAQQEMTNSAKMSMDKLDELYRLNSGQPLPTSRSSLYFPPLCGGFQNQTAANRFFDFHRLRSSAGLDPGVQRIRDWNEKNSAGLGEWACVGSLAMGNVRCFKREKDPMGSGRACEKAGGQVIACYDTIALWTPITSTRRSTDDAIWASWFDRPPKALRVMAGGVVMEERDTQKALAEKAEETKEMKLVAPLLRPQEFNPPPKPPTEPPAPLWEHLEQKILSGKGLSPDDLKQMTEGDMQRYRGLMAKIKTNSEKAGIQDVLEQAVDKTAETVGAGVDAAAQWTKTNQEHIESTVELMENMAFITGPAGPGIATGIEASAKAATVASKLLILKADGSEPRQYAYELALLLGPDQLKKLGDKGLKSIVQLAGLNAVDSARVVEEANTIADFIGKTKILDGEKDKK